MKSCKTAAIAILALAAAACTDSASVKGVIAQAPDSQVVIKRLDVNVTKTLDTVRTDAAGRLAYKVPVKPGDPEFVYVYYGENKIASMILNKGDKVSFTADTLGNYSVTGSEESTRLQKVENDFSAFLADLANTLDSEGDPLEINREISKKYIQYYRQAVQHVISNPFSITSVPVLFQKVNDGFPVFNQQTDAIHFRNTCDSLKTVYPESRFVKALEKEAERRANLLSLNEKIKTTAALSFPELNLPDIKGEKKALSKVDAKAILVLFWSATQADQKMFNLDSILPLYNEFHDKGLEIYAVSIDTDKVLWGTTVKNQNLKWINVCDGLGAASPAIRAYNVGKIPMMYLIANGELVNDPMGSEEALRNYLKKIL